MHIITMMHSYVDMLSHNTQSLRVLYRGKALAYLLFMWLIWVLVNLINLGKATFEQESWERVKQVHPNECRQSTSPVSKKKLAHPRPKCNLNLRKGQHSSLHSSRGENYDTLPSLKLFSSCTVSFLLIETETQAGKWDHTYSLLPWIGGKRMSVLGLHHKIGWWKKQVGWEITLLWVKKSKNYYF